MNSEAYLDDSPDAPLKPSLESVSPARDHESMSQDGNITKGSSAKAGKDTLDLPTDEQMHLVTDHPTHELKNSNSNAMESKPELQRQRPPANVSARFRSGEHSGHAMPVVYSNQYSPVKRREPSFPRRLEERRIDALAYKVSTCMKAVDQIDAAM